MDGSFENLKELTNEIIHSFSSNTLENNNKWTLLNIYHDKYLLTRDFNISLCINYKSVLSTLVVSLQPTLFREKWQETLFDSVFLHGILHESFLILVAGLDSSEQYVKQKIINLLQKFVQRPHLENLFKYQCTTSVHWNLKHISTENTSDKLIRALVSLPDRLANETRGKNLKVFHPTYYMSLLVSTVCKLLDAIHESLRNSQDCSLEFLAKLSGAICILGQADIVAKIYLKKMLKLLESDYIWRRISQNFICKMPHNCLDSFITNILLQVPWYGFVEWILGDEGVKNERINYIMTVKLLMYRSFKSTIVLQNSIGYFASSAHRVSGFIKILDSLLNTWIDARSLSYQNDVQRIYLASAVMICAGWLKQLKLKLNNKNYIDKILIGTQVRLKSSESTIQSIGMITADNLIQALDPDSPTLGFECPNKDLLNQLKDMLKVTPKPNDSIISLEDLKIFEETTQIKLSVKTSEENEKSNEDVDKELDSDDDDLDPYDISNDVPESKAKQPMYLRDCLTGLIQQENVDQTEKCLRHAKALIKANPYAVEEVAEEMAKILLHWTDGFDISDFIGLRHEALITLTVQCPIVVANYLTAQFTERDYTIRQRLDILEVLAASSSLLAYSNLSEICPVSSVKDFANSEPDWQIIINKRLEAKTKRYVKAQELPLKENKFSAIALNFFYPLLNSYEKACKILKLHEKDSYVLGRFIYTLGIIMYSASNTLHCSQMGSSFLQFLYSVRTHKDVFVRKAIIFSVATTYTAVSSSLLFSEMLPDVTNMTEWLQHVAGNDFEPKCVENAVYALSIYQSAAAEFTNASVENFDGL